MMIRQSSYIISFSLHLLLFLFIYKLLYSANYPVMTRPEERPHVSLTLKQAVKNRHNDNFSNSIPKEQTAAQELKKEIAGNENAEEVPLPESEEKTTAPEFVSAPVVEQDALLADSEVRGKIIQAEAGDFVFDESPLITMDELSLNTLLIPDGRDRNEPVQELYSIEFQKYDHRRILNYPDILLDYSDPLLATLTNCRISFTITREGLVENILMISPGSGSDTYDKIIEDLMVQLLFEPGREDQGVISLNFALIKNNGLPHD